MDQPRCLHHERLRHRSGAPIRHRTVSWSGHPGYRLFLEQELVAARSSLWRESATAVPLGVLQPVEPSDVPLRQLERGYQHEPKVHSHGWSGCERSSTRDYAAERIIWKYTVPEQPG